MPSSQIASSLWINQSLKSLKFLSLPIHACKWQVATAFSILVTHSRSLVAHSCVLEKTDLWGPQEKHLEFGPPPTQLQYPHWLSAFWHPSTDGRHRSKYCKHQVTWKLRSRLSSHSYCIHCAHEGSPALILGQRSFSFQWRTINSETSNWWKQWEWMAAECLAPNEISVS